MTGIANKKGGYPVATLYGVFATCTAGEWPG